ncbi:MAG: large-conductance mechanosensitive channel protein MscL [Phycisphaeraceae bacterium]|nr:large-conductance mechanosensitive channel protein MscL [Phycisphaeraceae bacterium]
MGFIKEFREFALKGNMLDLAVGVIIGGAFGGIVQSMIKDIIMPIVGMAGSVDFSEAKILLKAKDPENPKSSDIFLSYGNFITIFINFLILAFCIFIVVKFFNTARKKFEKQQAPPPPAGPTKDQQLLTEIRDLLAKK